MCFALYTLIWLDESGRKGLKLAYHDLADSGSSIVGGSIRENAIPEALYATIEDPPNASANGNAGSQQNAQNRPKPVYFVPSMTSPPPTYDAAIAKSWQVRSMNSTIIVIYQIMPI